MARRMRILVTGGAGFVGSHLCEQLLSRKHEVVCLDNLFTGSRKNIEHLMDDHSFEFIRYDVCDRTFLEVDEIYHLACPASPVHYQRNPVSTIRTAVVGTMHMLELAREVGARMLIASTSEVYGNPQVHPQVESYWGHVNPIGPRACYDEGKRCAEALAVSFANQYDVGVRIARIFNTYGPRMHENDGRVVSNFIVQALQQKPLTVYGDGRQTRSFCYVDDLVRGLMSLMESDVTTPVNLGNPNEVTVLDLAKRVISHCGSGSLVEQRELPVDDPERRRPDISEAQRSLGWSPMTDLDEGLRRTVVDFRARNLG